MRKLFFILFSLLSVCHARSEGLADPTPVADRDSLMAHYEQKYGWLGKFRAEAEASFTYPQHDVTPWFFFAGGFFDPVERLTMGVSYVQFLGLCHPGDEKFYATSNGLAGSLGYRLWQNKGGSTMWAKDFSVELRLRYAHSLGHPDMEYNLYDVGFMFYNARHRRVPCFQLGYRTVDARTPGFANMHAVYLSLVLR